jgi:hypothetical protein
MPKIDWANPMFPAVCLTVMFFTAYGGDWTGASTFLLYAWTNQYLSGENAKALPKESYLA